MAEREPFEFKRGATFMVAMSVPENVPLGYFSNWTAEAQIRKAGNDNASGLIEDLVFTWTDPEDTRHFTLTSEDTSDWPLGLAEIDVKFTSNENGRVATTKTVQLEITRNITR